MHCHWLTVKLRAGPSKFNQSKSVFINVKCIFFLKILPLLLLVMKELNYFSNILDL